jgi:hypothetical protein
MAKRKMTKVQTMIYAILHWNLKIEQYGPHNTPGYLYLVKSSISSPWTNWSPPVY